MSVSNFHRSDLSMLTQFHEVGLIVVQLNTGIDFQWVDCGHSRLVYVLVLWRFWLPHNHHVLCASLLAHVQSNFRFLIENRHVQKWTNQGPYLFDRCCKMRCLAHVVWANSLSDKVDHISNLRLGLRMPLFFIKFLTLNVSVFIEVCQDPSPSSEEKSLVFASESLLVILAPFSLTQGLSVFIVCRLIDALEWPN